MCVSVMEYTALSALTGTVAVCVLYVSVIGYTAPSVFVEDRGCSSVCPVCFNQGVYSTVRVRRRQEL